MMKASIAAIANKNMSSLRSTGRLFVATVSKVAKVSTKKMEKESIYGLNVVDLIHDVCMYVCVCSRPYS